MTPDDEGVIGAIAGYKIGKSMAPILGPIMLFGAAALLWNLWLGNAVLKAISDFLPLLIIMTVLFGLWSAWTVVCRFRVAVAPLNDSASIETPLPASWRENLAKVPLKFTLGAAVIFGWLVQVGIDNPWPPKPPSPIPAKAAPVNTGPH